MVDLLDHEDPKYATGAAKVLLAAEGQNQKDEHFERYDNAEQQRILLKAAEVAERLGIGGFGEGVSGIGSGGIVENANPITEGEKRA